MKVKNPYNGQVTIKVNALGTEFFKHIESGEEIELPDDQAEDVKRQIEEQKPVELKKETRTRNGKEEFRFEGDTLWQSKKENK